MVQYLRDRAPAAAVCQSEYTLFDASGDHQNVGVNFASQ